MNDNTSTIERAHGTCMLYGDVLWMMGVTITNLGYGDFTPSNYISRIIISILSLLGTLLKKLVKSTNMSFDFESYVRHTTDGINCWRPI